MSEPPPLRLLQVVPQMSLSLGGPLISALSLGAGLAARGVTVSYLTMRAELDTALCDRFRLRAQQIISTKDHVNRYWLTAHDRGVIEQAVAGSDVIHAHGVWESIIFEAVRAAAARRRPAVISACGMLDRWSLARKPLKKHLYRLLRGRALFSQAVVHATGVFEQRELIKVGIPAQRVVQISLPLPPASPAEGNLVAASAGVYVIGCLGRIAPGKGLELLLEAFAACLRASQEPLELEITGPSDQTYLSSLQRLAASLGVSGKVRFEQPLSGIEVHRRLASYDLFVLLSEHENFGLSIAEALAAGTPVVISPFTGLSELVAAEKTGTVCARESSAAAAALLSWYRRKREEPGLSQRCAAVAAAHFGTEKIAERWLALYRSLLSNSSNGRD